MDKLYNEQITTIKLFGIKIAEIKRVTQEAMQEDCATIAYTVTPQHYKEEFNIND